MNIKNYYIFSILSTSIILILLEPETRAKYIRDFARFKEELELLL